MCDGLSLPADIMRQGEGCGKLGVWEAKPSSLPRVAQQAPGAAAECGLRSKHFAHPFSAQQYPRGRCRRGHRLPKDQSQS